MSNKSKFISALKATISEMLAKNLLIIYLLVITSYQLNKQSFNYDESQPKLTFADEKIGNHTVEAYEIELQRNKVIISASDLSRFMYGGFEVADQLRMNGEVNATKHFFGDDKVL